MNRERERGVPAPRKPRPRHCAAGAGVSRSRPPTSLCPTFSPRPGTAICRLRYQIPAARQHEMEVQKSAPDDTPAAVCSRSHCRINCWAFQTWGEFSHTRYARASHAFRTTTPNTKSYPTRQIRCGGGISVAAALGDRLNGRKRQVTCGNEEGPQDTCWRVRARYAPMSSELGT